MRNYKSELVYFYWHFGIKSMQPKCPQIIGFYWAINLTCRAVTPNNQNSCGWKCDIYEFSRNPKLFCYLLDSRCGVSLILFCAFIHLNKINSDQVHSNKFQWKWTRIVQIFRRKSNRNWNFLKPPIKVSHGLYSVTAFNLLYTAH